MGRIPGRSGAGMRRTNGRLAAVLTFANLAIYAYVAVRLVASCG